MGGKLTICGNEIELKYFTDIDKLLAERITGEISIQTGFDLDDSNILFESKLYPEFYDIKHKTQLVYNEFLFTDTKNISRRVSYFMDEMLGKLLDLSADAASKVKEIHIQLLFLQRECSFRDRPLCDTLKVKTFEELMFSEKLKTVRNCVDV